MRRLFIGLWIFFLTTTPGFADDIDDQALHAAYSFASIIDDGNLQVAYWAGSPLLQLMTSEQNWLDQAFRTQQILGTVQGRTLIRIRHVTRQSRFPDDDYRLIYFEAKSERKAKAAEVILLHAVDGTWRVCNYLIH